MIHILVVDDHRLVGEGTKNMLESEQDFQVELVTSGTEAEQMMEQQTYDVYLLDWRMPDMNGIELSKRILQKQPNAKIVIYTGYDVAPFLNYLIESGITGFVSKTATSEQLITAIRCALRDEAVIPVRLLRQLHLCEVKAKMEENEEHVALSQFEQEILFEVANGLSNKDIAKKHYISQRSVERHLSRIFTKLRVSSRVEAVEKAKQLGFIPGLHMLTPSSDR
ncbi:response regulator transcription factor [Geobacillus sp. C56-T2]|uniref:response regulator transcription factor n=1 Tax=Geobacillus sp. C56-T2 TaxID=600773 RepID=UPI00119EF6FF|nr:response regulator transcription factor [Geobacillus sp. C56-T2]NNV07440.1 response regulator transcription factor [Geobacillus sp. MMMUD3]TWG29298.1 LuxR family two component transcriptional regulator [Geobacillus sp. C56-T2]